MAFDLDGFVKDLGITGEDEQKVRALFGTPERLTVLEKGHLRQTDYSKAQDAVRAEQQKLRDANDRVAAEMAEWARLQAEGGKAAEQAQARAEAAEAKALKLQQRVARLATEAGMDPAKALEGIETQNPNPNPEPKPAAPAIDPKQFVGLKDFAEVSEYMLNLATEIPMLAAEHQALTGERLDTRALQQEIRNRAKVKGANMDPRAIWEETHQISAKREAQAKAENEKALKAAEERGYNRARTESALPVPSSAGVRSPVLRMQEDGKSKLDRPPAESGIRSAAEKLDQLVRNRPAPAGAA